MNSPRFVSRINAELRPVLGDDRIVMGAQVLAVPARRVLKWLSGSVYLASALALVFVYLCARGHWHAGAALIGFAVAEAAAVALGLVRIFVQRPMLLAVTRTQLVWCRLAGAGKNAADVAAGPLSQARIVVQGTDRANATLRCALPGFEPVRLTSVRGGRPDLDRVLALARSSGVRVHTAAEATSSGGTTHRNPPQGSAPRDTQEAGSSRGSRRAGTYRNTDRAGPPPSDRAGRLGRDRPADVHGTEGRTAVRQEGRREHPGEHRRSGRGGSEPTRS